MRSEEVREKEREKRNRRRRKHSAKQDFQSQPVIRCGISIVHRGTGETEGEGGLEVARGKARAKT